MTVLYRLDAAAPVIARHFGADAGRDPWTGGHVAPGGFAPVITAGREFVAGARLERQPRRLIPRLWGVPPPPSAGDAARPGVLSVRNPDSPFWIGNLRNSEFRCLIPATAFMEWGKGTDAEGKRRQHWFACADQPLFAFAGVWKDSEVASFALLKRYTSGAQSWTRVIAKPVTGAVRLALNGVEQMTGWSVDTATGSVTFTTAPGAGVAITAGFEFDVPVRFDTDMLDVTLDLERLGSITSIPLLEIRR